MIPPYSSAKASLAKYYNQQWYMESRASSHITCQKANPELLHDGHPSYSISTTDTAIHSISRIGSTIVSSNSREIRLPHVFYVFALRCNLISIGSLADKGHAIVFTKSQCLILDNASNKHVLAAGMRDPINGLYHFQQQKTNSMRSAKVNSILTFKNSIGLWHDGFGFLHYDGFIHLSRYNRVKGLPFLLILKGFVNHVWQAANVGNIFQKFVIIVPLNHWN